MYCCNVSHLSLSHALHHRFIFTHHYELMITPGRADLRPGQAAERRRARRHSTAPPLPFSAVRAHRRWIRGKGAARSAARRAGAQRGTGRRSGGVTDFSVWRRAPGEIAPRSRRSHLGDHISAISRRYISRWYISLRYTPRRISRRRSRRIYRRTCRSRRASSVVLRSLAGCALQRRAR